METMKLFGILMQKYKNNLIYFIFKYVKNQDIAEDIFQDIIVYLLDKKEIYNFKYSFKTFLYTIAKSKSLNYLKKEEFLSNAEIKENLFIEEKLLEDVIFSNERQEKIKSIMSKMTDEYQMVIYLAIIEDLSYDEIAKIMNKNVSQIKNLLHRARVKLRKLLIQERVVEMKSNRVVRFLAWFVIIGIITTGVVYAVTKISENMRGKAEMTPTYTSKLSDIDTNKVWIGTFNLVWNDFMDDVIGGPIEFEDGESELANDLNKQSFTVAQLSEDSYFKIHGKENLSLKEQIKNGIKEKFNETSSIIDKCNWEEETGYVLYAMLKKEFNYLERFPTLSNNIFGDSEEKVQYFGLEPDTKQTASKNVEVLFYNSKEDFAVKLKTQEGEEVYLYKTTGDGKSFEENYNEMISKKEKYTGETSWQENDILRIPFIKVNCEINYDELCGRWIKGSDYYIRQALQTVDFELNNYGGSVKSEALIEALKMADTDTDREFIFDDTFLLFLKEEDKIEPYFALKVDDTSILVPADDE